MQNHPRTESVDLGMMMPNVTEKRQVLPRTGTQGIKLAGERRGRCPCVHDGLHSLSGGFQNIPDGTGGVCVIGPPWYSPVRGAGRTASGKDVARRPWDDPRSIPFKPEDHRRA